jgi:O-acetyl-ADP-ribose deacetylase (regulator of RNase III)
MITFLKGNMFESRAAALVNTVNCVGIMGKGIAHQFARAYPAMALAYARDCKAGLVKLGHVRIYEDVSRLIVNFPTKGHWRSNSRLEDIETGLRSLRDLLVQREIGSIAVPPLGCGNGGLSWSDVRPIIERELDVEALKDVAVEVFEPAGDFASRVAKAPKLTLGHFVLTALRLRLSTPSKLALHKSAYWFNVSLGEPYFRFVRHKFGPYAPSLEPMMVALRDFRDYYKLSTEALLEDGLRRSLAGRDVDRLVSWMEHVDWATRYCNLHGDSIEALSTAHAVIRESGPISEADLVSEFLAWSEEKAETFTAADVVRAVALLERDGLVERQLQGYVAQTVWRKRASSTENPGDFDPLRH